jgi:hypothetical protein
MQLWSSLAVSNWLFPSDDNTLRLLLTLVLPWLAAFALAFWGAWLGTRAGMSLARPFRAVAASVSAFVLVQVMGLFIAIAWFLLAYASSLRISNTLGNIGLTVALALVYAALVVAILLVAARVLDDLAVVGQAARRHQLDGAAQLGDVAHGVGDARVEPLRRDAASTCSVIGRWPSRR